MSVDEIGAETAVHEEAAIDAWIEPRRTAPLDLENGELFRARLLRLSAENHVFFFMPHHLVWDGISTDIFLRDLASFYESNAAALPPLRVQYADYASWQNAWLESPAFGAELRYWESQLKSTDEYLSLPTDKPRPKLFSYKGDAVSFVADAATVKALRSFSLENKCTSAQILLAVWIAFLHRISGQTTIAVGAPVGNREKEELQDQIGLFSNVVAISEDIEPGKTFAQLLQKITDKTIEAYGRQSVPMEYLQQKLRVSHDPSRTALYQSMFTHQNLDERRTRFGDLEIQSYVVHPTYCLVDLHLGVGESREQVELEFGYNPTLFSHALIERFANYFSVFLKSVIANSHSPVAEAPLLPETGLTKEMREWNNTKLDRKRRASAHRYFETCVQSTPEKTAIGMSDVELTYRELNARADAIGISLDARNVGAGDIVGIFLDRSPDVVAAMLGIWKAGAAFLPLDPMFPHARLAYMIEDSDAKFVISSSNLIDEWPSKSPNFIDIAEMLPEGETPRQQKAIYADGDPDARAYVIYTSGSSGNPKGVAVSHRSLTNFIEAMALTPGINSDDRLLAVTTISFDVMLLEFFLPLSIGAATILASDDDAMDGFRLADLIDEQEISVLQGTPATWRLLLDAGWQGRANLKCLCGGEPMPKDVAEALLPRVGELWNLYGPTETTVWSSCAKIDNPNDIHVGRPIANTALYIRDPNGNLTAPGLPGDLWIGGEGVAIGYLGKPELTKEKFRSNIFDDGVGVIYNTGDRARWRLDGNVEILGRKDDQVKIRGYRIELGDIEAALGKHEAVKQCVAAVIKNDDADPSLAAYVAFHEEASATGSELRRWLRRHLPLYMTPQFFTVLDSMPMTANNKIDRKQLPPPTGGISTGKQHIPPRNEIEAAFAEIWREILNVDDVSILDNFFELGGQSLQVARMVAQVRKKLNLVVSPRAVIFETMEQLASGAVVVDAA
ncbi:MAG: amino acid adenylation domain-containing protein [Marinicaulis sp.]|nr:amino acid adenylation domain-containing protein [Marinicaulis sp.]